MESIKPNMKVLIVLPFIPLDANSGGNQAVVNMLEYLRTKCRLTLIFPVRHHMMKDVAALSQKWQDVELRPYKYWEDDTKILPFKTDRMYRRNRMKMLKAKCRMHLSFFKHNIVSLNPADVIRDNSLLLVSDPVQYSESPFYHFVVEVAKEGFDIVQTEFVNFLDISYFLPSNVRKLFVHHELRFVRLNDEVALFPDKRLEDYAALEYSKDMEIAALGHYDDVIVLTEHDKKLLEPLLPGTRVHYSPATIPEKEQFEFAPCGKEFVFVGGMGHHPNLDGMLWFVSYVVPELRKIMTDFKVYVIGRWEKKFIKLITKACPEISFTGYMQDIGAFLNGKISVVPIRIGSGMRMKILDAINYRSPFVTTGKGVEGQNFIDCKECLIADTPQAFAQAMLKVSSDENLQRNLSDAAVIKLKDSYDSEAILRRRFEVYEDICRVEK